jgi:hypothetical protein
VTSRPLLRSGSTNAGCDGGLPTRRARADRQSGREIDQPCVPVFVESNSSSPKPTTRLSRLAACAMLDPLANRSGSLGPGHGPVHLAVCNFIAFVYCTYDRIIISGYPAALYRREGVPTSSYSGRNSGRRQTSERAARVAMERHRVKLSRQ